MNLPAIKASRFSVRDGLREIFLITERRGGAVYATRRLGYISCNFDYVDVLRANRNIIVAPASTYVTKHVMGWE